MGGEGFKHNIYPNVGLSLNIRDVWVPPPLLLTIFPQPGWSRLQHVSLDCQ